MIFKNGRPTPNDGLGTFHAAQSEPWQACAASSARVSARGRQTNGRAVSDVCKSDDAALARALTQPRQPLGSAATHQRKTAVSELTQRAKGHRSTKVRRLSDG